MNARKPNVDNSAAANIECAASVRSVNNPKENIAIPPKIPNKVRRTPFGRLSP
jgi:hypothetical protein